MIIMMMMIISIIVIINIYIYIYISLHSLYITAGRESRWRRGRTADYELGFAHQTSVKGSAACHPRFPCSFACRNAPQSLERLGHASVRMLPKVQNGGTISQCHNF